MGDLVHQGFQSPNPSHRRLQSNGRKIMTRKATNEEHRQSKTLRRTDRQRTIRVAKQGCARDAIGLLSKDCEIYILTFGQFSLIHALTAILDQTGPADVNLATWTASHAHLEESAKLLDNKLITSLRFVVDRSFLTRQPAYCARMRELFGDACIRTGRSHAKFMTVHNEKWNLGIRTSMNLNENPRLENLEISDDHNICDFLCDLVDDIFLENKKGDFSSPIPVLKTLKNVSVPGLLKYDKATAAKITTNPRPPTTGKQDE